MKFQVKLNHCTVSEHLLRLRERWGPLLRVLSNGLPTGLRVGVHELLLGLLLDDHNLGRRWRAEARAHEVVLLDRAKLLAQQAATDRNERELADALKAPGLRQRGTTPVMFTVNPVQYFVASSLHPSLSPRSIQGRCHRCRGPARARSGPWRG